MTQPSSNVTASHDATPAEQMMLAAAKQECRDAGVRLHDSFLLRLARWWAWATRRSGG